MKKFAVIGVSLLVALAVLAYVFLADRSADTENPKEAAPSETLSDNSASAASSGSDGGEKADAALQSILEEPIRYSAKSGAKTEFDLDRGEIGYVDMDSILQDRDPYSIVALLQQHRAHTDAGELLELEIESARRTHRGYIADFFQLIGGVPTEARGSVSFDSSGAVYTVYGDLFDPEAAEVGNIVIQQAEAEAIAREAAVRFVEPRRGPFVESNEPLIVEPEVEELRYNPTTGDASRLRAEWRVAVMTYQPFDDLVVSVDAETGEVVRVKSRLKHSCQQTDCPSIEFRVCDGSTATQASCNSTTLPDTTIYGQREDETWGCVLRDENGDIDDTKCDEAQYARYKTALAKSYARIWCMGVE